ncbi:hypothetical protein HKI87_06g44810 [Chloropicon roscoffensis]|uniref:Uncharacterized protein n=1 Tax=Chloropicon roscoffensis TaxID=1461544 RepID=A0AAX4PA36_9CHLO
MTKVTCKGSVKLADVKSGAGDLATSGSVTLVNALENGVKVKGVISSKALQTSSLAGCSLGVEKPGSLSAVYSFDSKTTKVSVFGKSTLQDREVKGKITYNQKGDAWTGEATVALDGPVSEVTASYDLKDKAVTLSAALNISGIDLEPEYSLNDKALSLSASKEINDIPLTVTYDFSSKDVSLEAKINPATVKLTTSLGGNSAIGLMVSTSKTFDV